MVAKIIFKLSLISYLILVVGCYDKQKKVYRFDRYDVCEIGPSEPFNVSYIVIKPVGYGSAVDGKFEFFRTIEQIRIAAKIIKCASKELLDSCEYVTTINIKNVCRYVSEKNTLLSPMTYSHHPPLTCPVKKGTIILSNGTFDPNLMNFFPLENAYWKMEISLFELETDDYLYKLCIDGQVVVYRE